MGISNFSKSVQILSGGTVANALASPLETGKIAVQNADSLDVFVDITAIGNMTDLRVRPYVAHTKDPGAFAGGGNAEWTELAAESISSGVATQDPYEAKFAAATWFPKVKLVHFRIPAAGTHMVLALYDGAGDGASSAVDVYVYHRRM